MKRAGLLGALGLALWGCGGKILDLARDVEPPRYATTGTKDADNDAGSSVPTPFASHQYGADQLLIDDTRIYWSTASSAPPWRPDLASESYVLRSCAKIDCAGTLVTYARSPWNQWRIALDGARIYWTEPGIPVSPGAIMACPIAGCAGVPVTVVSGISPEAIVVDDANVYWLSRDGTLLKCKVDGSDSPMLVTLASDADAHVPGALALDANRVFWIARGSDRLASGAIMVTPKDGSAPTQVFTEGLHQPTSLAIDAHNIYWAESYSVGSVKSCPLTGCVGEPVVLASNQQFPGLLGIASDRVYWFTSPNNLPWNDSSLNPSELVECPLTGCGSAPIVRASRQPGPRGIGVDGTHVYWTVYGEPVFGGALGFYVDGAVNRLRR